MKRYLCTIAYDGTQFNGYQIQPQGRTVQAELETALKNMHKQPVKVTASGRTDASVHAKGQVIHFDSSLNIPVGKWEIALNRLLPEDIAVHRVEQVANSFHARFDAVGKEYRYFLRLSQEKDPFTRFYQYHYPHPLDLCAMEEASNHFIGTHDFTSFCSAKTEVQDKVRTINEISLTKQEDTLMIRFVGNGFLYNMIRILVGTLLEVGSGKRTPETMSELLAARDRNVAGKTAPPHGLYLWEVFY